MPQEQMQLESPMIGRPSDDVKVDWTAKEYFSDWGPQEEA